MAATTTTTTTTAATAVPWFCYLLSSTEDNRTYVGVTPDLNRRLQQHNGERSGGAAATRGGSWRRVCHIRGFPDQRSALQFEWAWKHRSKRYRGSPLQRRAAALQELLSDARPTALAADYSTYPTPLEVVWEAEDPVPPL